MDYVFTDNGQSIAYDGVFMDSEYNTIYTQNGAYVAITVNSTGQTVAVTGSVPDSTALSVGTDSSISTWSQLLTAVNGAISSYQLNQINIERAKKGMSPINTSAYGQQIGVGLNAQTMQWITYGAIGLAAVFFLTRRKS